VPRAAHSLSARQLTPPRRGVGGKVLAGRFTADKRRKVGARLGNIRNSTMLKTRNPSTIAAPAAKYSHSVEVPPNARWLFTAGQVGVRPEGSIPEGFEAQHDQIWQTRLPFLRTSGWALRISFASTCILRTRTD
jgi:hypothetical protein